MPDFTLKIRLTEEMKDAMRAHEKERLGVIRLILAELKRVEVDERIDLDDDRVSTILQKMLKQRRDSITQFQQAGREDLVAKENLEVNIIQEFLPEMLSPEAIKQVIESTMADLGVSSAKDMGKLMGSLKAKLAGKADMALVNQQVKSLLSN